MHQLFMSKGFLLIILASLITGCGGGGGGGSGTTVSPISSEWDTMAWDRYSWS